MHIIQIFILHDSCTIFIDSGMVATRFQTRVPGTVMETDDSGCIM